MTRLSLSTLRPRPVQGISEFSPGEPDGGYYNDLTRIALEHGDARGAVQALRAMTADRRRANPVSVAQLGIGAWQLRHAAASWLDVTAACAAWIEGNADAEGRLPYLFAMAHTFELEPPWYSAMAQGEAVSLLVRASSALDAPHLLEAAERIAVPLLGPGHGLVTMTADGPVLQEYPTSPPAGALNGWIFALWGLYDLGAQRGTEGGQQARIAFEAGAAALARALPRYELALGWSRYDIYPHRIAHAASPFYHHLHVAQLTAMAGLQPDLRALSDTAARWGRAARSPAARSLGTARKVAFRMLVPRRPTS